MSAVSLDSSLYTYLLFLIRFHEFTQVDLFSHTDTIIRFSQLKTKLRTSRNYF